MDHKKYTGIFIIEYANEYTDLVLKKIISSKINSYISIFIEKKDKYKAIRDITNFIGSSNVNKNESLSQIDMISYVSDDARYIRKKLQIDNKELFDINVYISVYANSIDKLEGAINTLQNICTTNEIITKRATFRQKDIFTTILPINENPNILKEVSRRNILSDTLSYFYPFISNDIYDKKGILYGKNINENNLVIIDKFDRKKYKNGNMCIFGASGSGKSYYTKLQIIRERLLNRYQYVIDPENEYSDVINELQGEYINFGCNKYINVFDLKIINLDLLHEKINRKIESLKPLFIEIFENIKSDEYLLFEKVLKELYIAKKNINLESEIIFEDVFNIIIKNEKLKKYTIYLEKFISGSLSFCNKYTNIKSDNKLIGINISNISDEDMKYIIFIFLNFFWEEIKDKENMNKEKIIYIDEIWKLMNNNKKEYITKYIYDIFKTIRKYNACAVAITQDITDIFSFNAGNFGTSILNNSSIKAIFSINDDNIKKISEYIYITENEKIEIRGLNKGECILMLDNNNIKLNVISSNTEKNILKGDK